jgi:hypothetical protein
MNRAGNKRGRDADLMARGPDGRWEAGFDRLCVCGHRLGLHTAARPHTCIASDFDPAIECACERFRRSRHV